MALGQPIGNYLDNLSTEGHMGGDIDGSPNIDQTNLTTTLTVGGNVNRSGQPIDTKDWTYHKGKAITAKGNADNPDGYLSLSGNNERVNGILISVDDDGRGTIGCVGFNLELEVPDTVSLTHADIGQPVLGAGDGKVKPLTDASDAANPTEAEVKNIANARGIITAVDDTAKKVMVNLWA